jgi:hypothetical protein
MGGRSLRHARTAAARRFDRPRAGHIMGTVACLEKPILLNRRPMPLVRRRVRIPYALPALRPSDRNHHTALASLAVKSSNSLRTRLHIFGRDCMVVTASSMSSGRSVRRTSMTCRACDRSLRAFAWSETGRIFATHSLCNAYRARSGTLTKMPARPTTAAFVVFSMR